MTTVPATLRALSACADEPGLPLHEQHEQHEDEVQALALGACRSLSDVGAFRACALLLRDERTGALAPAAACGVATAPLLAQLALPDLDGAVTHALATERATPASGGRVVVVPLVAAGGVVVGAAVGRRDRRAPALGPALRQALTAAGRLAALALQAQRTAREDERARQRRARLELSRDLHATVVQRLFGASLALSARGPLSVDERRCCADELQLALGELRAGLLRAATREDPADEPGLADALRALSADPDVSVSLTGDAPALDAHQDATTRSVLAEAVRNARKHAGASTIHVAVHSDDDHLTLDVVNATNNAHARPDHVPGVGLQLAAAEVLEADGLLGSGPTAAGQWRVQLTVPRPESAS